MKKKGAVLFFLIIGILGISCAQPSLSSYRSLEEVRSLGVPAARETEMVYYSEMIYFINNSFPNLQYFEVVDSAYYLSKLADLKQFLALDDLDQYEYQPEWFDCDDFASVLDGRASENYIPLGMVTFMDWRGGGQNHRLNLFITIEEGELIAYFIEPREDRVWKPLPWEWKKISVVLF